MRITTSLFFSLIFPLLWMHRTWTWTMEQREKNDLVSQLSHFFLPPACCSSLLPAPLRVRGVFAPSIVSVLQLWPLTSALLVACSVANLGMDAPFVSTVILKSQWREEMSTCVHVSGVKTCLVTACRISKNNVIYMLFPVSWQASHQLQVCKCWRVSYILQPAGGFHYQRESRWVQLRQTEAVQHVSTTLYNTKHSSHEPCSPPAPPSIHRHSCHFLFTYILK